MSRWRAFFSHLAISALVIASLLALFMFYLFPSPFFFEDGGWRGVWLIALVDVTIGPLLTFIVCSKGKSRGKLIFDITVIVSLQLCALTAGLWLVYATRTESLIYADGTFYTVDAQTAESFKPPYRVFAQGQKGRPFLGVVDLPDDSEQRQRLRLETLQTNIPLFTKVELLRPLDEDGLAEVAGSAPKAEKLFASQEARGELEKWLTEHNGRKEDYLFVPTWCRYGKIVTVLDRKGGSVAGYITGIEVGN